MLIIIAVVVILIILYIWYDNRFIGIKTNGDPHTYYVVKDFANHEEAAKRLSIMNKRLIKVLRKLRGDVEAGIIVGDKAIIVANMLRNYNPERVIETNPTKTKETSFTIGKGDTTSICLRKRENPLLFVDINTLMFVALHELAHIGAYNVNGHTDRFWGIFRFVLEEATKIEDIYEPVDYEKNPINYCGLNIDYNPLFDDGLILV